MTELTRDRVRKLRERGISMQEAAHVLERSDLHVALVGIMDCVERMFDVTNEVDRASYKEFRTFRLTVEQYMNKNYPLIDE